MEFRCYFFNVQEHIVSAGGIVADTEADAQNRAQKAFVLRKKHRIEQLKMLLSQSARLRRLANAENTKLSRELLEFSRE